MTTIVLSPSKTSTAPAGREVTASRFSAVMRSLWKSLEVAGQRRAANHLLEQARVYESTQPGYARELKDAAEAALRS